MYNNHQNELTKKYKEFPDEANADAWAIQDACNLQAIAQTFMCMARAADFNYDNPAVLATLDKMNSLCSMQGVLSSSQSAKLNTAYEACISAYTKRVEARKRKEEEQG